MRSVTIDPPVLTRLSCQRLQRTTASSSTPAHEQTACCHEGLEVRTGRGMMLGRRGTGLEEFRRAHIYNRRMSPERDPELFLSRSPSSRLLIDRWPVVPVVGGATGSGSA
jgi:hypothetical protein